MALPSTEAISPAHETLDTWDVPTLLASLWEGQLTAVAALGPSLPALARATEAARPASLPAAAWPTPEPARPAALPCRMR